MPHPSSIVLSRRNRRLDQRRLKQSRMRMGGIGLGILLSILLAVLILLAALGYADLTRDLPNVAVLPALLNPPDGLLLQPTRLYDRTGEHLLHTFDIPRAQGSSIPEPDNTASSDLRRYLPLSAAAPQHLPDFLAKATVEMLDPGFWTSGGYTLAGLTDPEAHPTIAQKLVSDLLLYDETPSLRRALRERILAAQLISQFGRSQALEWYLNSADYGNDAYGVDAASELYFGVSATDLTPGESAVLAATSQAPGLNPLDAPDLALERGRTAIQLMQKFGLISAEAAKTALAEKLSFRSGQLAAGSDASSAISDKLFVSLVLHQLDPQFSELRVRRGGLSITSTLDFKLQQDLTSLVLASDGQSSSGLVLDPLSGQILAAAGETLRGQETALMSPHDPGTLMSPFIYLTAFTRGFGPGSLVWDIPSSSDVSVQSASQYHGPVRMRIALANDYQAAAQRVAAQMGSDAIGRTEASFGLEGPKQTLLDMASAYGIFAANGVRYGLPGPSAVLRVEGLDRAPWLDLSNPQAQPVVTPALAYLIDNVLSDESARWPSLGHPNDLEIGRPAGVKLGQSADGSDTWGIGYTPSRVAAVWMAGSGPPSTPAQPPSSGASPSTVAEGSAGHLLSNVMQLAVQGQPADGWAAPADVSTVDVCDPSGLLPTRDCPTTVNEVFLSGNEPVQADTLFHTYTVNRETGFLATVFTPPALVEDKVFMVIPPEAQDWAKAAGVPSAPASYDAIQAPPVNPDVHISKPALFSDVTGKVQFRGTASGANFARYRLVVGQGLNPQEWTVVTDSSTRIEDGVLGSWDTSGLSGLYAVELQVIRTDQQIDTAITQITVK